MPKQEKRDRSGKRKEEGEDERREQKRESGTFVEGAAPWRLWRV